MKTREEAIGWAERYGKILGEGEIELGKVNEPWDIGLMPAPENPPLLIEKEAGELAASVGGVRRVGRAISRSDAAVGKARVVGLCGSIRLRGVEHTRVGS